MTVGERIRDVRKAKKMTQSQLAAKLGVHYMVISQYESGKRKPKFETLQRVATALDVTPLYLMGLESADQESAAFDELLDLAYETREDAKVLAQLGAIGSMEEYISQVFSGLSLESQKAVLSYMGFLREQENKSDGDTDE